MTTVFFGQVTPQKDAGMELKTVVLLSRHGVRSPLESEQASAQQYSNDQWPPWHTAPGLLTPHGRQLMVLLGSFYRDFYIHEGLYADSSCNKVQNFYFYSDLDQRNIDSAKAVAEGMFPKCDVEIHTSKKGRPDPIIGPIEAGLVTPDYTLAGAAVRGRIGDNLDALEAAYYPAFTTLEKVLLGCLPDQCSPRTLRDTQSLLFSSGSIKPGANNGLVKEVNGTFAVSSAIAEMLLLEYANGMPMAEVGWGRMNEKELTQILSIRSRYFDLTQQTQYIAQVRGSNLLSHIYNSLAQSASNDSVPGSLGTPADKFIFISAHDTNLANVGALFGAQWLVAGGQFNSAFPGSALVFELRRKKGEGSYWVSMRYISQTPAQLRNSQPLTLQSPPAVVPVFIPGCSTGDGEFDCRLDTFKTIVQRSIKEEFVSKEVK